MSEESFEEKMKRRAAENRQKFTGKYGEQIKELQALSPEELERITPTGTDKAVYDQLIAAVEEASVQNLSQAELKQKVEALGNTAIEIARKIPSLASIVL
ncbi:hypothetical protein [Nafulsella turpanensis]|uniref:hypothetical protein n=1 Tax=Nafulsella turpanensis TaxID=1265690 RepID=UPI000345CDB3|nr:hypothetical protein [Nafulsella turpanensis]